MQHGIPFRPGRRRTPRIPAIRRRSVAVCGAVEVVEVVEVVTAKG
jgi:hypothetical protein